MVTRGFRAHRLWPLLPLAPVTLALLFWPSALFAATSPVAFSALGSNGSGVSDQPGIPCAQGGAGASWHYHYDGTVTGDHFSSLGTEIDLDLDLHSESPGAPPTAGAWLLGTESRALLRNPRGTLTLELTSGSCASPTLAFDGTTASGAGTWVVADGTGTGSYRGAVGAGTFRFTVSVGPGADNAFEIDVHGSASVLDPRLAVEVVSASWDNVPHAEVRYANVTFRVVNAGLGDAFGVRLRDASTDTPGVAALGPMPQSLGDIGAGGDALVTVRYQFDRGPCADRERGCALDVDLAVEMADALDASATHAATARVSVPTAPHGGRT